MSDTINQQLKRLHHMAKVKNIGDKVVEGFTLSGAVKKLEGMKI
jgi:hypothetical protein